MPSQCSNQNYTGLTCQQELHFFQTCLFNSTREILISSDQQLEDLEEMAEFFFNAFPILNPSQECLTAIFPLLCLYIFPMCGDNGTVYQPSSAQCVEVSTGVCREEWENAVSIAGDLIPSCSTFSDEPTVDHCMSAIGETTEQTPSTESINTTVQLMPNCSLNFFRDKSDGLCKPVCNDWEALPHSTTVLIDSLLILGSCVYLVSAVVALGLSLAFNRQM